MAGSVTMPLEDYHPIRAIKEINHQGTFGVSGLCSAWCSEHYSIPKFPTTFGFNMERLPAVALADMVDMVVCSACTPSIPAEPGSPGSLNRMLDIGLVGPNTLAGQLLYELKRRMQVYISKEFVGRLLANRPTPHVMP